MEVILLDDVFGLGRRGDTVKVQKGYARNFLLPRSLALEATSAGARVFQEHERVTTIRRNRAQNAANKEAAALNKLTLTIPVQAGEDGKLFGSVTSADIAEELARSGHAVDKRSVVLEDTLRELGVYHIRIKLFQDVEAKVRLFVTKQS
jgi:large subunit ribosomal protein L9